MSVAESLGRDRIRKRVPACVGKAGIRMSMSSYARFQMHISDKPSFDSIFLKFFVLHNLVTYSIEGIPVYSMELVSSADVRERIVGVSVSGELDDHSIIDALKERFDTYIASRYYLKQDELEKLLLVLRVSSHCSLNDADLKKELECYG